MSQYELPSQRHDGAGLAGYGLRLRLSRPTGARNAAKAEVGKRRHQERCVKSARPHCITESRKSTTKTVGKQVRIWTRHSATGYKKAVRVRSHVRDRGLDQQSGGARVCLMWRESDRVGLIEELI